jgi:hypothetical protein
MLAAFELRLCLFARSEHRVTEQLPDNGVQAADNSDGIGAFTGQYQSIITATFTNIVLLHCFTR